MLSSGRFFIAKFLLIVVFVQYAQVVYAANPKFGRLDQMEREDRFSNHDWNFGTFTFNGISACFVSSFPIGRYSPNLLDKTLTVLSEKKDGEIFILRGKDLASPIIRVIFDFEVEGNSVSLQINSKFVQKFKSYSANVVDIDDPDDVSVVLEELNNAIRVDVMGRIRRSKMRFDYSYSLLGFNDMHSHVTKFCG